MEGNCFSGFAIPGQELQGSFAEPE